MHGDFISIRNKLGNLVIKDKTLNNYLKERNIEHYSFTFDLVEYDFKNVYKTFNISYFSKDNDLFNHNFVDSQELQDYEDIKKITNDLVIILIRKFKLRLSFRKNRNFSKEIIISDDNDFNPEMLKFDEKIIKIAIVKDNLDKWKYLENYDYIFTYEEYVHELDECSKIFQIDKAPIFNQIKFILNNLYKRNLDKFYQFVKEIGFHDVFPKWKYYFMILNSDFFNYQWYLDTHGIEQNTDSVIHFLFIGYKKGYNPSPNFSIEEYYECNPDVKRKGINPLVHYERYGKKENRAISLSDKKRRDYDLISNSSYFDKKWYERTYDVLSEDTDSVNHYLNVGFIKRYNPGPDFNTQEYFECNRDIKAVMENPLVHYELFGKKEKRTISFSEERHREDYNYILNSEYFNESWYMDNYGPLSEDMDPVYHYLNIGYAIGYNPGPDFNTDEYYECHPDVKKHGMNALLHYEKFGKDEGRPIYLSEKHKMDYELILNSSYFDKEWYEHTYDVLSEDEDSVNHYLDVGFIKRYNPSPVFNTQEYFECNRDIKAQLQNPLVHYELFGKKEKRTISFSEERHREDYNYILNSEYFNESWYMDNYGPLSEDMDPVYHYLNIGYAIGYNPGPDFSTDEYYECNPDVKEHGMNALLHYERFGKYEGRSISLKDKKS